MSKPKNPKLLEVVLPPDIMGSDITLWDIYFGMAMQAMIPIRCDPAWIRSMAEGSAGGAKVAAAAAAQADAMLAERAKREGE